jgi:DNA polymerase III epsilon subunit-like protein
MCYPKPGPRCSGHTRELLQNAQAHFDKIAATHDEESIEFLNAKALLNSAKSIYRSSPAGIAKLTEDVKNAPADMDKKDKALLEKTLNRAVVKREIQKNAYVENTNGRLNALATLTASETNARFDEAEAKSILQVHTSTFASKELSARKANFNPDEEAYSNFVSTMETKFANGTPEQKEAVAKLKTLPAPDAPSLAAYVTAEEGFQKAEVALSLEEARIASFHNISNADSHAYYDAYRNQYKKEYANLPATERPDPPKNWTNTEIRSLSPNTLGDYKYLPKDAASTYAAYRLRADAKSVKGHQDEAIYASLDLETAGPAGNAGFKPSNGHIIEVGIVKYNNKGEEIGRYSKLMRPPQAFLDEHGTGAEHIHKISVKDLDNQPSWDSVSSEIITELKGTTFIAQNANFEQPWLTHHLPGFEHNSGQKPVIDTLDMSRRHFDIQNHRLQTICGQVGVAYTNGHRATHDAEVTGSAFFKMRKVLQTQWDSKPARRNAKTVTI